MGGASSVYINGGQLDSISSINSVDNVSNMAFTDSHYSEGDWVNGQLGGADSIRVFDTYQATYHESKTNWFALALAALSALLATLYWREYIRYLDRYNDQLNRMLGVIEYKHRWYIDNYYANKESVYAYVQNIDDYEISVDKVQGVLVTPLGYNEAWARCSKQLSHRINQTPNWGSMRIESSILSTQAHSHQRRLRDVEALEIAYDTLRMDMKHKFYTFIDDETDRVLAYYQNGANHLKTLMQMASKNFNGNMTSAIYNMGVFSNSYNTATTSYSNASTSGTIRVGINAWD